MLLPEDVKLLALSSGEEPERTAAGHLCLDGRCEWMVEGPAEPLHSIETALGSGVAQRLTDSVVVLRFGNAVGFFEAPALGRFEVVSGKWRQADFDAMLADLSRIAAALPFRAGSPGSLPFDRSVATREQVRYHLFAYLRYVLAESAPPDEALVPALTTVVRDPHRRRVREPRRIGIEKCREVRPRELARIASGRYPLARTVNPGGAAARLGGRLPIELEEPVLRWTLDTPENRFVKLALEVAVGVLDGMDQELEGSTASLANQVRSEILWLRKRLKPFLRAGMWQEVGDLRHLPGASTVLQRKYGYRTVFSFYQRLRMASRVPVQRDSAQRLLESRDIAELYELWCFFRVVEQLQGILGPANHADSPVMELFQQKIPWNYRVTWTEGVSLYYNRSFGPTHLGGRRSYSVALRPDITLELRRVERRELHFFDAKFRLQRLDDLLPSAEGARGDEEGGGDETTLERRGTFKRGDLYKMHTYRDAIRGAESVWVLYPGSDSRFYAAGPGESVSGVGAVPLVPGLKNEAASSALGRILSA